MATGNIGKDNVVNGGKLKPKIGTSEPIKETGTTEPETGTTESETGTTEPETGATEPETGTTEPKTGATEPETGTTEPETGTSEPIKETGTTEPKTGTTEPETGTTEPETGTSEPIKETGNTEPETGTTEPKTGTTEPETGSTEPETGTTEPETGTTEPETGTTEPETGTTEPETATTESETGTTEPETLTCEPPDSGQLVQKVSYPPLMGLRDSSEDIHELHSARSTGGTNTPQADWEPARRKSITVCQPQDPLHRPLARESPAQAMRALCGGGSGEVTKRPLSCSKSTPLVRQRVHFDEDAYGCGSNGRLQRTLTPFSRSREEDLDAV